MDEAIAVLKQQGAVIVDPADIPSVVDTGRRRTTSCNWTICGGLDNAKGQDADCSIVFKYGMKRDFNAWLTSLGRGGAGQDAHRARGSGTSRTSAPAPSSTARRSSTSRTRWTCRRTARVTRPTARRTSG